MIKNLWGRFWSWYQKRIIESLIISTIILYLQIPHTITAAECFFSDTNYLFGVNPITDFLLYGIDLLELIPIIALTSQLYAQLKGRKKSV